MSLRRTVGRSRQSLALNGLDLGRLAASAKALGPFLRERRTFRAAPGGDAWPMTALPVLADRGEEAGVAGDQYFQQDLHVAKLVLAAAPERHVDVGSRIDGFIAHLLMFREVEVVDVRPLTSTVEGLTFVQGDGTTLDGFADGSIPSLSSLHAVEHFGLGRYGDPLDPLGSEKALAAYQRVLARGGRLYLSVPVGRRRIEFNAHRVFDPQDPVDLVPELALERFDGIDDQGRFLADTEPGALAANEYGLGIYTFARA